jgi:hypothetical protein
MAIVGSTYPTLANVASRLDPNGRIAAIAEVLSEQNQILEDMPWIEGNQPTGHTSVIRTGLPSVAWRALNYGVAPSKSTTAKVTDAVGLLEAYALIDQKVAELNGNTSDFRASEDKAFLESMNQEFADTVFYGNVKTDEKKFHGLTPRFSSTSAGNGGQIIKGSSNDTDNASIWLIGWGENSVHGIYPKGSRAGLQHTDKGLQTITDAEGGKYEAFVTHYRWECGLVVRDWRQIVRIPNIEISDLLSNPTSGDNLIDLMAQACEKLHNKSSCRPVFYMNRTLRSWLRRQIYTKSNVNLTLDNAGGKTVMSFDEIPVKVCDSLLNTESIVS